MAERVVRRVVWAYSVGAWERRRGQPHDSYQRMTDTKTSPENQAPGAGTVSLEQFPAGLHGSWERSISHGLKRQDRALFNHCVSRALTRRIVDENDVLISHAREEMSTLHRSLDSGRWLTMCINVQGEIVHFVGDRSSAPRELQVLMYPGRRILEAELGTNAPGCALEERRPIVVSRGEHFLLELEEFFCASAPILDPTNQLLGVLDISGVDVRGLPLASDLVDFAARRIENNMVGALPECTVLRFHSDERLLGSPFEAVLAVDSRGIVKGSNRAARQLLVSQADGLLGQPLGVLIEGGLDGIARAMRASHGQCVSVPGDFGRLSFLKTDSGRGRSSPPRARAVEEPVAKDSGSGTLICEDPGLKTALDKAVRVLRAGLPIVVHGETGTGKELIAKAMHGAVRPQGPFVALNCAAIPESLIEAELFGHVEGAFTGARKGGSCGKIELADRGLLFLDEIGDMSLTLQTRLLRVLQERTVTRVGDHREIPVDLLVVCATHRNLHELVAKGAFREDLFYRLNGYSLQLPALRDRADMRAIIEALMRRWNEGDEDELITEDAIDCLADYSWPGNIRQLEQVIRALLALRSPDAPIDVADLPAHVRGFRSSPREASASDSSTTLDTMERKAIQQALATHGGNVSAAAKALGISRGTLYKKMKGCN